MSHLASQQNQPKRNWWARLIRLGQDSPEAGFSGWLVIWTAFLCILTALNVWVLHSTDRTLYAQAVAKDRGFHMVDVVLWGENFQRGPDDPIYLRMLHRQSGAAYLRQLTYYYEMGRIGREKPTIRWDEREKINWSAALKPKKPHEYALCIGYSLPAMLPNAEPIKKDLRTDEIQLFQRDLFPDPSDNADTKEAKLKSTFFVHGSSHYESIKEGRTEFCYYLDTNATDEPSSWKMKQCPEGHSLD